MFFKEGTYSAAEDFFAGRTWAEMKGFLGEPDGNYFIGLDNLHVLTEGSGQQQQLKVELWGSGGVKYLDAHYDSFSVLGEADNFRLEIGGFLTVRETNFGNVVKRRAFIVRYGDVMDTHIHMQ